MNNSTCKRAVKFFILAAAATILAALLTYIISPDVKSVTEWVDNRSSEQVKEAAGIKKIGAYIVNNGVSVPLQMLFLAFIPVQFLYLLNILTTSLLPGILFGILLQIDLRKGLEIIASAIPHYVIEVFALCLFAAILFELNRAVRGKIRNVCKKDKERISFGRKALKTVKIYVLFVLPLIALAAFVETYIGDMILSLIQK
ncbi:stage II sporulation protein M [Sporosarcina cascadiensis]|uniref:stage II sporulation protein M n=1 Tax=Sporosarcina cascadiensis TaxID=2660747 RepID=UPI002ED265ED